MNSHTNFYVARFMRVHRDRVFYSEKIIEAAFRGRSIEVNKLSARVIGYRSCIDGCWAIVSCQNCGDSDLESRLRSLESIVVKRRCPGISSANFFSGSVSLGSIDRDPVEFVRVAADVCDEFSDVDCEFILNVRDVERVIDRFGDSGRERKVVIDVIAAIVVKMPRVGSSSFAMSFVGDLSSLRESQIERILKSIYSRAQASAKAKLLNPLASGRAEVILRHDVAAALFHELSHLLEADAANHLSIGAQIGPPELDIYDDPKYFGSSAIRLFDDEGVTTFKRSLIEGGVVVDLHHTLSTAHLFNSRPGSAHGLFHAPRPFHTALVVKPGDWNEKEVIEETKRGFLAEGLLQAETIGNYIRIVPETTWYIERGEIKEPIRIRSIKIPLQKLKTITALTKTLHTRTTYEKGHLITETTPTTKLQAYIE